MKKQYFLRIIFIIFTSFVILIIVSFFALDRKIIKIEPSFMHIPVDGVVLEGKEGVFNEGNCYLWINVTSDKMVRVDYNFEIDFYEFDNNDWITIYRCESTLDLAAHWVDAGTYEKSFKIPAMVLEKEGCYRICISTLGVCQFKVVEKNIIFSGDDCNEKDL